MGNYFPLVLKTVVEIFITGNVYENFSSSDRYYIIPVPITHRPTLPAFLKVLSSPWHCMFVYRVSNITENTKRASKYIHCLQKVFPYLLVFML